MKLFVVGVLAIAVMVSTLGVISPNTSATGQGWIFLVLVFVLVLALLLFRRKARR